LPVGAESLSLEGGVLGNAQRSVVKRGTRLVGFAAVKGVADLDILQRRGDAHLDGQIIGP